MTESSPAGDGSLLTATLIHLRRALRKEISPLGMVHAFHDAGFATGPALFDQLSPRLSEPAAEADEGTFWMEFGRLFEEKGWGTLAHERLHPGLAVLRSNDWTEADPTSADSALGCAFSSGVLAHVLGRVADRPVGVLEVHCRSRGDGECAFVFGSETAVHDLYGLLIDGASLESALAKV